MSGEVFLPLEPYLNGLDPPVTSWWKYNANASTAYVLTLTSAVEFLLPQNDPVYLGAFYPRSPHVHLDNVEFSIFS